MICALALFAFGSRAVSAEPLSPKADDLFVAKRWMTENGLPQNSVTAIAQTPDGYLWLGTFNGLVRFDGVRFTTYTTANTPDLRSDHVTALGVAINGTLWIGTSGGGLLRFSAGKFVRMTESDGLDELEILFIVTSARGELWVGSMESLFHWTAQRFEKVARSLPDLYPFRGMALDRDGRLWVATGKGIRTWEEGRFKEHGPTDRETHRVAIDDQNAVWYYDDRQGLLRLRNGESAIRDTTPRWPEALVSATDGQIWAGGNGNPLTLFKNGKRHEFTGNPLLNDSDITSIFPDREGNVWVGLDGGGLVQLRPKQVKNYSRSQGLPSNNAVSITQDSSGRIWIGRLGSNRGISWLLPDTDELVPDVPDWGNLWASSCFAARDGKVWIGTFGAGVFTWQDGKFEHRGAGPLPFTSTVGNVVRVLFEDSSGGFWIGTDTRGVEHFKEGKVTRYTTDAGLSHNKVTSVAEDPHGGIWIGTAGGLNRLSTNGVIRKFTRADGLRVDAIHALHVDARGSVWVGTASGGLSRFDGRRFATLTTKEGLINDVVAQIIEDDFGNLWVGTNRGIGRLYRRDLDAFMEGRINFLQCLCYGNDEGMVNEECGGGFQPACLKDAKGRLWFCTVGGVVMIDPARTRPHPRAPEVYVEEVWLDGRHHMSIDPVEDSKAPVDVPPGRHSLEVRFTGLHFGAPEKTVFRYKLDEFDRDWVNAGTRRSAFYTQLPPGQYRFHVTAGNNEGVWNETGASLALVIRPAWWQARWFHVLLAIATTATIWGFFQWRIRRVERERARKAEFSRRLIEFQEAERQRISRELHDSLGQSLLVIKNRAYLAMREAGGDPAIREHINEICEVSTEAVSEVRQISHALRPAQLDRLGLSRALHSLAQQMATSGDVELRIGIDDLNGFFSPADQINLLRIVQETLSNILKHARASSIDMSVRIINGAVHLVIDDDGRGFDVNGIHSGLGLMAIRERVEMLGGHLEIHSEPGRGTQFRVRVPMRNKPIVHESI